MKTQMKKTTTEFIYSCESEFLTIQADEEMNRASTYQSCENAMESLNNSSHGRIRMRGETREHNVIIEVVDNGPGIIKEALVKIFVPFFTTKKARFRYWIEPVATDHAMHNGTLTVESVPECEDCF